MTADLRARRFAPLCRPIFDSAAVREAHVANGRRDAVTTAACVLCGQKALYRRLGRGYCRAHRAHALVK